MELTANVSSDRSWVYKALDFSEGAPEFELFAIKFANTESAHRTPAGLGFSHAPTTQTPLSSRRNS